MNPAVSWPHPAHRGAPLERRLDGGAGRRRDRRTGPGIRQPAPGNSGPRAGAAPALPARNRYPGGVGAPPGDTTVPCQELADDRWARCAIDESAARRRKENAAAERRKARRPASWAGDLRRSGDRSARETDHRVRRSAPAPVGALLPLIFLGSGKGRRAPGARSNRAMMLGCLTTETDCRAGKARRACPPPTQEWRARFALPALRDLRGGRDKREAACLSQNPPMLGKTLTPC